MRKISDGTAFDYKTMIGRTVRSLILALVLVLTPVTEAYGMIGLEDTNSNGAEIASLLRILPPDTTIDVPLHLSPITDSYQSTEGLTVIDWQDVADESNPVQYVFQLSESSELSLGGGFKIPMYTSELLSVSEFVTPALSESVYYWQVKAVDFIGNESAWSDPWKATVDNTGPITVVNGPSGTVMGGSVAPKVEATDIQKPLTYGWAAVNPAHQSLISDASLAEPTISPTVSGTYEFTLTTRDPSGNETIKTLSFVWALPIAPPVTTAPVIPASPQSRAVASANAAFNQVVAPVDEDEGDVLAATDDVWTDEDEERSVASTTLVEETGDISSSADPLLGTVVVWLFLTISAIGGLIFWVFKSRKHESE